MKSTNRFVSKNIKKGRSFVIGLFLIWQVVVEFVIRVGVKYYPTTLSYMFSDVGGINPVWLWPRANFDGIHYLDIARRGYGIYQQAFFPLYPRLIAFIQPIFRQQALTTGWLISFFSLLLALYFLRKLLLIDHPLKIVERTLIYLLIFPTAFYFSMVYTESLFLLFVVLCFYSAKTKRWLLAGIIGAFASAIRLPGIFLAPALLVEWWEQNKTVQSSKFKVQSLRTAIPILLIPLGSLWYMRFLWLNYSDPLMFLHMQKYFGVSRSTGDLILIYQVLWRYIKMLVTVNVFSLTYLIVIAELFSAVGFLAMAVIAYLKKWYSYAVFMVLQVLVPSFTGTFLSMHRFVLILFPGFLLMALFAQRSKVFRYVYPAISIVLFVFFLLLFTRGYWVA